MARENSCAVTRARGAPHQFAPLGATANEIKERQLERTVGGEAVIAHAELLANRLHPAQMGFQALHVLFGREVRVYIEVTTGFNVVENRGLIEIEGKFSGV